MKYVRVECLISVEVIMKLSTLRGDMGLTFSRYNCSYAQYTLATKYINQTPTA